LSGEDCPAKRIFLHAPTGATHPPSGRIRTDSAAAACRKQGICFSRLSSNERQSAPAEFHFSLVTIWSWQVSTKRSRFSAVFRKGDCDEINLEMEKSSAIGRRLAEEGRKHELDSRGSRGIVPVGAAAARRIRCASAQRPGDIACIAPGKCRRRNERDTTTGCGIAHGGALPGQGGSQRVRVTPSDPEGESLGLSRSQSARWRKGRSAIAQ
jgi:hypothetical protein